MKIIISITTLLIATHSYSQDDKQGITNAVMDYVDAFYFGDTTKILRSISQAVVKYCYYRKKEHTVY